MAPLVTTPPHSVEAERTVLGALILDPDAITQVAGVLEPNDFYDPVLANIYAAIRGLYELGTPIDFLTVTQALNDNKKIQEIGGSAFLAELAGAVPTASHVAVYAKIVREKGVKRHAAKVGRQIEQIASDSEKSADEVIESAEQGILQLSRQSTDSKPVDLIELRDERYEHYTAIYQAEDKEGLCGLTTGFVDLDTLLTGMPAGDLLVIAARPSMGKTAFALNIAKHVADSLDKSVMICSLEMSKEQLADRIFAGALEVTTHDLKKGLLKEADFKRMGSVFDGVKGGRIYVDDDPDTSLVNLRSKARRQQIEHGLDLLIVDYLQLIELTGKAAGENRVQQMSQISRNLKKLARELSVPVIALSQLSRACELRAPPVPILADLRESGSIEQDADTVLMLYREDYYRDESDRPGITDVYVRKHRQGPTGRIELHFNRSRMSYESISKRGVELREGVAV